MDSNTWNYLNIPRPLWHSGSQTEGTQQINSRPSGAAQPAANGSQMAAGAQQKNPTLVSPAQSSPQWTSALPAYQQGNPTMVSPAQSNAQPPRAASAFPAETPIGMAYVPFQKFGMLYDSDTALQNGTIFAELFKPWLGGRAFLPNGSNTPVTADLNDLYSNYFRMSGEGSVRK